MRDQDGVNRSRPPSKSFGHNPILRYWLPLLLYLALIYLQSAFALPVRIPLAHTDKVVHVLMYAVLGVLFLRAYLTLTSGRFLLLWAFASVVSAFLYGLTDEWHQSLVPGRAPELLDVVCDGLGGLVGAAFYGCLFLRVRPQTAITPD